MGLYACNEIVTQNVIRLLKELSKKYVPTNKAGEIVEEVFFGGNFEQTNKVSPYKLNIHIFILCPDFLLTLLFV